MIDNISKRIFPRKIFEFRKSSKSGHAIGERLAVTTGLLLLPSIALVYLYVGQLNNKIDQAEDALNGLHFASRLNAVRMPVLQMSLERYTEDEGFEESLHLLEDDLYKADFLRESERTLFSDNVERWRLNDSNGADWRMKALFELDSVAERIDNAINASVGGASRVSNVADLLLVRIPNFSEEVYRLNHRLRDDLKESNKVLSDNEASQLESEIMKLSFMGNNLYSQVAQIFSWSEDVDEKDNLQSEYGEPFERYLKKASRLLRKKLAHSQVSNSDLTGFPRISDKAVGELWELGRSFSVSMINARIGLEGVIEKRILAHRDSITFNRNLTLFVSIVVLALLIGYCLFRNVVLGRDRLRDQNEHLEAKILERVQDIERAKLEAEEAASIAERERENALSLNKSLKVQTKRSNRLANKAMAAKEAESQFLANMSHEIRTPLNGVIGMTHLLLESELGSAERKYVDTLSHCTETLLVLINDVLDISKIEAGKMDIEQVECDLVELASELATLFAPSADEKDLDLLCMYPSLFERKVCCDPYRLRQVISNLINNAIKFTNFGNIRFEVDIEDTSEDEALVCFSVRDTGIGISKKGQRNLFKSFSQADASTTRHFGGTGLGLAISSRLVELMGGELLVESEEGVGSTFRFILKMKKGRRIESSRMLPAKRIGKALALIDSEAIGNHMVELFRSIKGQCDWRQQWEVKFEERSYRNIFIDSGLLEANRERVAALKSKYPELKVFVVGKQLSDGKSVVSEELEIEGVFSIPYDPLVLVDLVSMVRKVEALPVELEAEEKESQYANFSVLLVDDNDINLLVATELFRKYGVEPVVVKSGKAALEACENQRFDLIFMDCMMPGMNGYATTQIIRAAQGSLNEKVPIVALTANAMGGDRELCLDAGMSDYLSKPLRFKDLGTIFERWINPSGATDQQQESRIENRVSENVEDLELLDISEFRSMFEDEATFTSLVASFTETMNETVAQLEKEISETQDLVEMRILSHSLKSSSTSYGAHRLSHAVSNLETACRLGNIDEAIDLFENVKQFSARTERALKEAVH